MLQPLFRLLIILYFDLSNRCLLHFFKFCVAIRFLLSPFLWDSMFCYTMTHGQVLPQTQNIPSLTFLDCRW